MSRFLLALTFSIITFTTSFAQTQRITHEIVKNSEPKQSMGRDLWFTMAENYQWSSNGKYYDLYVTSPAATTINITVGIATSSKFPIKANQVVTFRVPLAWELTQSGVVEEKAIHVWSETADLSAYLLSRNPYTSDGMYIIPSVGWGTEYIVAAYHSHWAGTAGGDGDLPSEFCIVANADNTVVTVVPTTNIRDGQDADKMLYKAGVPFTVVLDRGEAVQYQAMRNPSEVEGFDFTGTRVTSTKPIGIVGGVMCANIPVEVPYCDHICDMIPPVRTWAQTYYTAPFISRKGGDTYLVIASADNQTITRVSQTGTRVHAILNKYEHFYRHDIEDASRWESNKPFLLAQYCNSTEWPGGGINNNGIGDPAMTIVNSVEQYTPKVIFQTPTIQTGQAGFRNFVNVLVHKEAVNSTTFDGELIAGRLQAIPIDNTYIAYRGSNVAPGTHTVVSDSGVGVYIYGYGSYDSYAWTGGFGTRTFLSPDTIPPNALTSGECFKARVDLSDIHLDASKLHAIDLDTSYNMNFTMDAAWIPGQALDRSFYELEVLDPLKEAIAKVIVYDAAGNTTTITSKYIPQVASIDPPLTDFGIVTGPGREEKIITITNEGQTDFNITTLKLQLGNKGFQLEDPDLSPLKPGEKREIRVSFLALVPETVGDTILFGDECLINKAVVIGNGGAPDYSVFGVDICPVIVGGRVSSDAGRPIVSTDKGVYIKNGTAGTVTLTKISLSNNVDFEYDPTDPMNPVLPRTLALGEELEIRVTYKPTNVAPASTDVIFEATGLPNKIAQVTGCAIEPGAKIFATQTFPLSCTKTGDAQPYAFTIQSTATAPTQITSLRLSGDITNFSTPSIRDQGVDITLPAPLPAGRAWDVSTTFIAQPNMTGTYRLMIEVIDGSGNVLQEGVVEAIAVTDYKEYEYVGNFDFGTLNFSDAPVSRIVKLRNKTASPINVDRPVPQIGNTGSHPTSFTVVAPASWPIVLGPNQEIDVTIQFDPSLSTAAVQTVNFAQATDACETKVLPMVANVKVGGFTVQSFETPQIFSCATSLNPVTVRSDKAIQSATLAWTIVGNDAAQFTTTMANPQSMTAQQTLDIPVLFTAIPGTAPRTYDARMDFIFTNDQGEVHTGSAPLTAVSGGITANVTSNFATTTAEAGDVVTLPMTLTVQKNVQSLDLSTSDLRTVHLVYSYNTDLLTPKGNALNVAIEDLPPTWTVDMTRSQITPTGLDLWLTGANSLTEADLSLGKINFDVRLPEKDETDEVRLESFELFGATGQSFGQCVATTAVGTQLNLVYRCGDAIYQQMMRDGKLATIEPLTPNPITNERFVTFRYGTRVETPVTIEIIDALGNVIDRVVDGLYHNVGAYEVKYDVSKLESGGYIYRFLTHETQSTHRFVVTK